MCSFLFRVPYREIYENITISLEKNILTPSFFGFIGYVNQ